MKAQFQTYHVSPLGSWSQAVTLLASVNRPGSQEDVVINWQPAHSLVEDAVSGTEIAAAPCLPALVSTCLPLCLQGQRALYGSRLALFCIRSVFVLWARQGSPWGLRAFLFFLSFFFFVSLATPRFALLTHISLLRLFSEHSGPVLTLRTNDTGYISLPSPHSWWQM